MFLWPYVPTGEFEYSVTSNYGSIHTFTTLAEAQADYDSWELSPLLDKHEITLTKDHPDGRKLILSKKSS